MAVDPTLQKIYEALEEHVKTGALDKLNAAPPVAAITGSDSGGSKFMSRSDVFEMRGKMLTKSEPELMAIWGEQSARRDIGVPLDKWASRQGNADAIYGAM